VTFFGSFYSPIAIDSLHTTADFFRIFSFAFRAVFSMDFCVQTLSLPVGVTVHCSQDPAAHATIFWDNAFSPLERVPFQTCDSVAWETFAFALRAKFKLLTGCERDLSTADLHYIAERLFDRAFADYSLCLGEMVTWNRFLKVCVLQRFANV